MRTLDSKKKPRLERVESGLFRYKPFGSYYTVLKKDGKTKWRNLQTTDKATARRMLADERDKAAELDSNLSGLELAVPSRREVVLGAMMCQNRRTYGTSITRLRPHDGGSASGDLI